MQDVAWAWCTVRPRTDLVRGRSGRLLVMIGTSPRSRGGIASVVKVLTDGGLFDACPSEYVVSHADGPPWTKLAVVLGAMRRYLHLLLSGRVGLAHIHVAARTSFWRKLLFIVPTALARVPLVLHLHAGEFVHYYERGCAPWTRWLIRRVISRADRVIVLSRSWHQWLASAFPGARVEVVGNPVSVPQPAPDGARTPATLVFLGRIERQKGAYDLLEAVAKIAREMPGVRLKMAGDGDLEEARRRIESMGQASHVALLGWVEGDAKERLLRDATVFVLPSYNEILSMSLLEAMAHGLPVVSTRIGGIGEAVTDGVEGFLVMPGDVDALTERLLYLLRNAPLRQAMGEAARSKVESRFAVQRIVPQLLRLYGELGLPVLTERRDRP